MLGKFSVKKPYTVLVAVVLVIVLGVVSFTKMSTDLLPSISLPYVIVMTTYPGASPETVEMVVTKPVEASMATVSNIEEISSVSSENYSVVILEFAQSTDMNAASLEIRETLDQIKSYWSDSVGNPIIMKLNPDMLPIMIAAVGGVGMTDAEVSEMTQNTVIPELESIEGVASASATGLLEESVNVIIRQEKIDAINVKVFGYIDDEMKDAEQELADARQEIADGQAEINDAKAELEDSKKELVDSQKELDDSRTELKDGKQKIIDGKNEIAENKTKLEEGKNELANKKDETAKQLAEAEKKILTAKADLEATKMHLTMEIETIKASVEGLKKAQEGLEEIKKQAAAFGINDISEIDTQIKQLKDAKAPLESLKAVLNALPPGSSIGDDIAKGINDALQKLGISGINLSAGSSVEAAMQALEVAIPAIDESIEKLEGLKSAWNTLQTTIDNLQNSINVSTMGLGADAYIAQLETTLSSIEKNIAKLDKALTELYKGNLTAAIEFANAQTAISLGEFQITTAESQLEASEKQIETGEEQLEEGQKQLDSAWDQIKDGEEQLNDSIEQLKDALQQIVDGEEELEEARENAYNQADMNGILTVDTVKSLLAAQNFTMPAGYVTEEGIDYLVRVGDKPEDIEKLKKMPIMNPEMDGVDIITLEDVADVFMTDNSADIYANVNGEPGIMITMQKQTGYSTGDVSDKILDKFEELKEENDRLILITLMDQGIYIDLVMDSIINNVLFGAILAVLVLIVFLKDWRPTAVVACSIPISLITAIVCMYFSGITLNVISLSGLALGVGMLVDNSIVVIENIYRMRSEGYSAKEAAVEGAGEVAGAILASTLTTVCVFLPIVFTEGITRQLFVDMGLTIAYSLLASLLIALTVVPAVSAGLLTRTKTQQEGKLFGGLMKIYGKALELSLNVKPLVIILVLVLLVLSAVASFSKGIAFMPDMDSTQISMTLSMPKDTPLTDTAEVTDEIVERLMAVEDVIDVGAMASTSSLGMLSGGGNSSTNETTIYISLDEDKKRDNLEIADDIEESIQDILEKNQAEASIETATMDMSALGGSGISIQIKGRELDTLQEIAKDIAAIVESVEGTTDVSDGLEESTGEMRIIVDRNKAIEHGLTVAQVFQQIQSKLADATSATTLETEIEEYDVYVKHAKDMALTRELVKELELDRTKQDGTKEKIKLSDIATFESTQAPKSVNRIDQTRYISVSAAIADGYNVGFVSSDVEDALASYKMPSGYTYVMSGENETIVEAMGQVYLMLLLAIIFMYLIMVAQFQSLLSPFIIMFTIPLAFTGGFMGLAISGSEVSVIALIGFVMLSGIIVNNGIVLVDYINQLRERGMEKREAIITAGKTRIRPVMMTALTTILALSTMAFSDDMGADMSKPMSVVTIGGLIYGTLLTLVVIPCIYDIFMRDKNVVKKKSFFKMLKKESGIMDGEDTEDNE
ncbi:MAG: efflux RND transporter permease subunit [Lachnospiraceae bacterium]|nr:efflux RND transporter permease subunit [Lachnospiraceae bacterium]